MKSTYNYLFKILLIGNSGVGKSCIMTRFVDNDFSDEFNSTIGVDFKIKTLIVDNKLVKLQIWDTAGQERFKTITSSYYRGAHGIIIVYDITDRKSFSDIINWIAEIKRYSGNNAIIMIVGNKSDMKERVISYEEGQDLAYAHDCEFYEVSAKTNSHITEMFNTISFNMKSRVVSELKRDSEVVIITQKSRRCKCLL